MGNQLTHGYLENDLEIIWDVVEVELPALLEQGKDFDKQL